MGVKLESSNLKTILEIKLKVRAKLQCFNKFVDAIGNTQIRMEAIYSEKDGSRARENMAFSDASPAASFTMTVSKGKPAADAFEVGQAYYLDFTPANTAISVQLLDTPETTVESEIVAKGLTAPRVTPERIEEVILNTEFYVFPGTTLTVCCLTLKNGYTVLGESACASPANFDANMGEKIALQNAKQKIWALEGYALRERLAVPVETD